ncbi:OPT oligopeptide transporter protein-domain-containing protein [Syncephalis fuscata]|nr:OPT oligopeptide transporter protein-domain-containing protein [Syncephalis fuscata]
MDESRRTTFMTGSSEWRESDQQRQYERSSDDHYFEETRDTRAKVNTYNQIDDMFTPLDDFSTDLGREIYATDPQPRHEYSRYLDHQAADEMEIPHNDSHLQQYQYDDKKYMPDDYDFDNPQGVHFYDQNLQDHGELYDTKDHRYYNDNKDDDDDGSSGEEEEEEEENSPIEIVAATVSTFDDPTLPCLTFRFWVLGTFFTVLGASISQVIFGWSFSLNPGPFNMKEHMLIYVASNSGGSIALAVDIVAMQHLYYKKGMSVLGSLLLIISSQCIGYGMGGLLRRFLVKPANMIWPSNLVQVALYNTLHATETSHQSINRQKFFMIAACCVFVYQLLPNYIAPILSSMALLCWILPESAGAQVLGSGFRGMGLMSFNFFVGAILALWVVAPILYFKNVKDALRFDPLSPLQYDEDGNEFDIGRVLNSNLEVDSAKLAAYSQLRMAPYLVFTYFTGFITVTATLTHVFLYYRKSIYHQFKASREEKEDIHSRMMRAYPEVPASWYIGIFVTMFVAAIIVCEVYTIRLPWWALIVGFILPALLVLPMGIIQAVSNNRIGLNLISEFVCGYILPGRPIANAAFKVYSYMTMYQCLVFVEDMKLGHYMKVPPRKLFAVQVWGTVLGSLVNYSVFRYLIASKEQILSGESPDPTNQWASRNTQVFYSASIMWGAIGPARLFNSDPSYNLVLWGFLFGILLPIPFYLLHKRYPEGKWHLINIPIVTIGTYATPTYFLYRRHHGWWKRYNYVFSAALDAGAQIAVLFTAFALSSQSFPTWYGNDSTNIEHCNFDSYKMQNQQQITA